MAGIFKIKNNVVQISPEDLPIPEMRAIWEADKSKAKEEAYKTLSYIYFLCDYKSPYYVYPENRREEQVIKDFIRDPKWKPSKLIKEACDKYNEFQGTPSIRLLKAIRKSFDKIIIFLEKNGPEHKNYASYLEKVGKMTESLDKVEERVKQEQTNETKIRGGGEVSSWEV